MSQQIGTIGSPEFIGASHMSTVMHFPIASPRSIVLATAALALALPAHAADLAVKAPAPPPLAASSWTGFYAGANFGAATTSEEATTPFGAASPDPAGAIGGGQIGYNFQLAPAWLLGIEGDIDGTSVKGTTSVIGPSALSITSNHNWYATLAGRAGYVAGPWLFYAKAGGAWMNADYQIQVNSGAGGVASISSTRFGWTAGAGVEYQLMPKWTVKAEYDYLDFGSSNLNFAPIGTTATFKTDVNEIKVGANYHF
jgi:outer membrane immunogenic protein